MAKKTLAPHDADPQIRFEEAVALYGTQSKLARALNLERGTVSGWKDAEFIPPLQAHRLRCLHPDVFRDAG